MRINAGHGLLLLMQRGTLRPALGEGKMTETITDDLATLLPPLLRSLEALGFIARYFNPGDFDAVMEAAATPDDDLRDARPLLDAWPAEFASLRDRLATAADAVIAGFDGLRAASEQEDGTRAVFRALRQAPRAQEALYPLAAVLPAVSRFFLAPPLREDPDLQHLLTAAGAGGPETGVMQADNDTTERGGFSLYVPETYTPDRPWPVVFALHGGSGHGRAFLWTWLRDARAHGAILVAPTALGDSWAMNGRDDDTPNLARILDYVRQRWTIDPARILLTGMSDGGTFSLVSGLEPSSPFTHLAPVAATFHPMVAEMADPDRLRGLPIFWTHGALDWLFPVSVGREANSALSEAGAKVTYREFDDLAHTYPREVNPAILDWLAE
jgi:phospholipase/carboxylesterase